jgi:DNA polymerase
VPHLHIDFETRSTVDLKAAGLDNYAKHPTTDVWCMAYAFGDGGVCLWEPKSPQISQDNVRDFVAKGGIVVAHNAAFELAIWNQIMVPRYGWPVLKPEQCRCTMAMAYSTALPGALDNAAAAVGIQTRKDQAGYRLMMQMCRPREIKPADWTGRKCPACKGGGRDKDEVRSCAKCAGTGDEHAEQIIWWDEPAKLQQLYEYCKQDVRVERELEQRLMPLSDEEQALWVLDYKINQRGIYVDRDAAQAAIEIVTVEQDRLNAEMRKVTDNFVGFCTEAARLTKWVQKQGVMVEGIAKADIVEALALPDLPANVRAALLLRQEAAKSSTAKLRAMVDASSADGRLRGMLQYHGAGTGRWAGRKVQLHNMPRPSLKQDEIDDVFEVLT